MSDFKPTISREQFSKVLYQFTEGAEAFYRLYKAIEVLEGNLDVSSNIIDAAIYALLSHFDIKEGSDLHDCAFDLIFEIADEASWRKNFEAVASDVYAQLIYLHDKQYQEEDDDE